MKSVLNNKGSTAQDWVCMHSSSRRNLTYSNLYPALPAFATISAATMSWWSSDTMLARNVRDWDSIFDPLWNWCPMWSPRWKREVWGQTSLWGKCYGALVDLGGASNVGPLLVQFLSFSCSFHQQFVKQYVGTLTSVVCATPLGNPRPTTVVRERGSIHRWLT